MDSNIHFSFFLLSAAMACFFQGHFFSYSTLKEFFFLFSPNVICCFWGLFNCVFSTLMHQRFFKLSKFFCVHIFFVSLSLIKHVFGLQVYFLQYCFLISTPAMLLYVCQYDWVQLCFSRITAEEQNIVCLSETTSVFICVQMEERLQHVVVLHMLHSN